MRPTLFPPSDLAEALESLRTYAQTRGQAWLTHRQCQALLDRIEDLETSKICGLCGVHCAGELVEIVCDGCAAMQGAADPATAG